jgi:hypothetical protein
MEAIVLSIVLIADRTKSTGAEPSAFDQHHSPRVCGLRVAAMIARCIATAQRIVGCFFGQTFSDK